MVVLFLTLIPHNFQFQIFAKLKITFSFSQNPDRDVGKIVGFVTHGNFQQFSLEIMVFE